jgi:S-disulfanyl-L-cysteine oxidoreductase SoxD
MRAIGFLLVMAVGLPAPAQDAAPPSVLEGAFTDAEAARGEALYQGRCAACHGVNLVSVVAEAPTLTAPAFKFTWVGKSLGERFERIKSTMPLGNPGILADRDYLDIVSYILKFNGYPTGSHELEPDPAKLRGIRIAPLG